MLTFFDGKQVKDWFSLVGKRCIVIENRYCASAVEVKVIEVSPKGRVKFEFPSGIKVWEQNSEYRLIEELPD